MSIFFLFLYVEFVDSYGYCQWLAKMGLIWKAQDGPNIIWTHSKNLGYCRSTFRDSRQLVDWTHSLSLSRNPLSQFLSWRDEGESEEVFPALPIIICYSWKISFICVKPPNTLRDFASSLAFQMALRLATFLEKNCLLLCLLVFSHGWAKICWTKVFLWFEVLMQLLICW